VTTYGFCPNETIVLNDGLLQGDFDYNKDTYFRMELKTCDKK